MRFEVRRVIACSRPVAWPARAAVFAFSAIIGMAASSPALAAAETPRAGVAGAVVGDVDVAGEPRPEPLPAQSGMDIFMQDRIATAVDSRLQVLLLDETVFTVGPKSQVTIDKFVYDPDSGTGELTAEFSKGFMRYVSGKVGKNSPEKVTVETPASTIGIRGTSLYVSEVPDEPDTYVAGLLGPGPDNTARAKRGGFTMTNAQGTVTVSRPGFGAFVTEGEAPGEPTRLSSALLDRLHTNLRPRGGHDRQDEGTSADGQPAGTGDSGASRTARAGVAQTRTDALANAGLQDSVLGQTNTDLADANDAKNRAADNRNELIPDMPTEPSANANVPFFAQAEWTGIQNLDLVVAGFGTGSELSYFVTPSTPEGPTGPSGKPVAVLDNDATGLNGSEVATINNLADNGTLISVINSGDSSGETTGITPENLTVSLLQNGTIQRGPEGSVVVEGTVVDEVNPSESTPKDIFIAYQIGPDGAVIRIPQVTADTLPDSLN